MKLTKNYTTEELSVTLHREVDNTPPEKYHYNLTRLAKASEEIDLLLGTKTTTLSAFRCKDLNIIVGGSKNSRHMVGLARDFIAPQFGSPRLVCETIAGSPIDFDQLIYERTWVHFGLAPDGIQPRKQLLTYLGHGAYAQGLIST